MEEDPEDRSFAWFLFALTFFVAVVVLGKLDCSSQSEKESSAIIDQSVQHEIEIRAQRKK